MAVVKQMEDCLDEVKVWMALNSIFMNDGKTQYLPIVPKSADAIVDKSVIRVGKCDSRWYGYNYGFALCSVSWCLH